MKENGERRKYPRVRISFPISFRVSRLESGRAESDGIKGIGTRTQGRIGNISLEGLFIEANPTQAEISEIIRAKQGWDRFGVEIETNLLGENMRLVGKVMWYDINFFDKAPYHFRAGIFLDRMDRATGEMWERLVTKAGS